MLLLGVGAGLSFPSLMTLAMSGATQSDSGLASGLVNTSLQVGGALGLAVLATLSTTRTDNLLADGEATNSSPAGTTWPSSSRRAWWRWRSSSRRPCLQASPAEAAEEGAEPSRRCRGGLGVDRGAHLGRRRLNVEARQAPGGPGLDPRGRVGAGRDFGDELVGPGVAQGGDLARQLG